MPYLFEILSIRIIELKLKLKNCLSNSIHQGYQHNSTSFYDYETSTPYHDAHHPMVPHGYIPQGHPHNHPHQVSFGYSYEYNQSYISPYGGVSDNYSNNNYAPMGEGNLDSSKPANFYTNYNQNCPNNGSHPFEHGIQSSTPENIKSDLETSSSELNLNHSCELSESPIDDKSSVKFNHLNGCKEGDSVLVNSKHVRGLKNICKAENKEESTLSKCTFY